MKAVDTNILIRWVTRDDVYQTPLADGIMRESVLISLTVMVEFVWVLSSRRYGFNRSAIVEILRDVVRIDTVTIEQTQGVRWSIDRYADGADFADMIHIVAARGATSFVTFDRDLHRDAGDTCSIAIETLG